MLATIAFLVKLKNPTKTKPKQLVRDQRKNRKKINSYGEYSSPPEIVTTELPQGSFSIY